MDDITNDRAQQDNEQVLVVDYNNPSGCSLCSCKMFSQDHGNKCTCGHNSEKHTGNDA